MKKLLIVLMTVALMLGSMSGFAEATGDAFVQSMLPVLDSVLRTSWELQMDYTPRDSAYFWTVLGMLSVNWGADDPQCEIVESELRVPRLLMREYASAAFFDYDDLLSLPEEDGFFIRYDEEWDSYFVMLSDMGEVISSLHNLQENEDGTVTVEMTLDAPNAPKMASMVATLVANPYADAVAEPTYLWSVSSVDLVFGETLSRTRTVLLEGSEEELVESRYTSDLGFTIWLDAIHFYPSAGSAEEGYERFSAIDANASLTVALVDVAPDAADSLLDEAVGDFEDGAVIGDRIEIALDEGGASCESIEATVDDVTYRFYLIKGADKVFTITAEFPAEAAEGWGARLEILVKTLEVG